MKTNIINARQIFYSPAGFFSAQMHQDVSGRDADDDVIHDERAAVGDEMNAL